MERHDCVVNVSGYDSTNGFVWYLKMVNAATTVDNVDTSKSQVVIINQDVHITTVEHNLLFPMQMQMHVTVVNDTLTFLLRDPSDDYHCVLLKNYTLDESLRIPLKIQGVSSVLPSRHTNPEEYKHSEHFISTSNASRWNPHDALFGTQEAAMTDSAGRLHGPGDESDNRFIAKVGLMGSNNLIL